ncbi:MAG TPA: UbiH/UbiF/VisC/COQ6 family ubiquinone biosynthesis hydroxylase [Stellaceae bacterium]|nr:UbiH/UbiF/VisC/COQ6 family ubiquinone biosynthesis hydroxylase [Stellaceae bacterium]
MLVTDVAIAGGGLVGLSLGIALAGAGVKAVVIDREAPAATTDIAYDGRASAIAFGSRQVLAAIGLWDRIAADAQPILDIRVVEGRSPLFLHYDHREVGAAPLGWIVENRILRRALLAGVGALPDLVHLAPVTVDGVDAEAGGATVRLADGRRIRAGLVVAADGKASPLRRAAGIRTLDWSYPQHGIVTTVEHARPHHGAAIEQFRPSGPFAILPMTGTPTNGNRSSIVWTERSALVPRLMALDDAAFEFEVARRFDGYLGVTRLIGPRFSYPLSVLLAERTVDRRLALVGDAAHVIHPIAGQGLNLGIRDVAALAEVLVDAHRLGMDLGAPDVLARYQRWRRTDILALAAVTDGLNRLFSNRVTPLAIARNIGLGAVERIGPLKRLLMRHAMGTLGDLPRLARGERL